MELKLAHQRLEPAAVRTFNRTLWNWNFVSAPPVRHSAKLLIVPYGIETQHTQRAGIARQMLLIVPYGIETEHGEDDASARECLLIVPYGIETHEACAWQPEGENF